MRTHVALLRGINLGGHNRVAMADLRKVVSALGHTDATTYLQSGNVAFATTQTDTAALAAGLEGALADELGVRIRVVLRSRDELARVIEQNPYPHEQNPKLVHAIFLAEEPGPGLVEDVAVARGKVERKGSRDTAQLVDRTIYLHTPDGFGRSELATALTRGTSIGASGTARNWSTVTKLLTLCDG